MFRKTAIGEGLMHVKAWCSSSLIPMFNRKQPLRSISERQRSVAIGGNRVKLVLCTGVSTIQTDERWWRISVISHPHRVEAKWSL